MLIEMKLHASSVSLNLGCGAHDYVEFIILLVTYASIAPLTPFSVTLHQGHLNVNASVTQY